MRRLVLDKLVGVLQNESNNVKEVKALRKKLSKEKIDLDEINALTD